MRMRIDLVEVGRNAVLGGKASSKLNGAGWLEPLVDSFLTAAEGTFTVSLRPCNPFVEGTPDRTARCRLRRVDKIP
jgi:hypothetical protein